MTGSGILAGEIGGCVDADGDTGIGAGFVWPLLDEEDELAMVSSAAAATGDDCGGTSAAEEETEAPLDGLASEVAAGGGTAGSAGCEGCDVEFDGVMAESFGRWRDIRSWVGSVWAAARVSW